MMMFWRPSEPNICKSPAALCCDPLEGLSLEVHLHSFAHRCHRTEGRTHEKITEYDGMPVLCFWDVHVGFQEGKRCLRPTSVAENAGTETYDPPCLSSNYWAHPMIWDDLGTVHCQKWLQYAICGPLGFRLWSSLIHVDMFVCNPCPLHSQIPLLPWILGGAHPVVLLVIYPPLSLSEHGILYSFLSYKWITHNFVNLERIQTELIIAIGSRKYCQIISNSYSNWYTPQVLTQGVIHFGSTLSIA